MPLRSTPGQMVRADCAFPKQPMLDNVMSKGSMLICLRIASISPAVR